MHFYLRVLSYYRADGPKVLLLLLLIGLGTALGMLQVWPLALLVDTVVAPEPRHGWVRWLFLGWVPGGPLVQITWLAASAVLIRVAQEVLNLLRSLVNFQVGYAGLVRVRCDLYRKLQALNIGYHKAQPHGDAIYRLNSDTGGVPTVLGVFVSLAVAACTLLVLAAIMLSRSAALTLLALSVVPFLVLANVRFGRSFRRRSHEAKARESEVTTAAHQSLASIGLTQAFGREEDEFRRYYGTVRESVSAWCRFHKEQVLYGLTVGVIFGAGGALILGYGGYLVYRDQFLRPTPDGMTAGDLVVFLAYLGLLYDPLCKLTGAGASLQEGAAGARRVFEVLDREPAVADAPDAVPLPPQPRTLCLEGVGLEYTPGRPVLKGVDAVIRPGEMVAFVGASGVGKSSLLNLLPRFYDPTEGRLTLDGQDARRVRLADLRRHIALVLQESVLLPVSVAENIAYGRPGATAAEIRAAAALAGADAFIRELPEQYDTRVAEGGGNLSGGQRQRIAIARALLTGAPVLVLDEPTSALDPDHEHLIVQTLKSLQGLRTIILVTHRLATAAGCDCIFVMHEGGIVEQGTHAELLARGGHYARMARRQLGAVEVKEEAAAWPEAAVA